MDQVKAGDQFDEAAFEASSATLCANTAHICCVDHSHRFGDLSVRSSAVYHEFSNLVAMVDERRMRSLNRAIFVRIQRSDTFDRRRAAETLPARRRQPEQLVAAKSRTPLRRERDGAPGFRRRSGHFPGPACLGNTRVYVCAAVQVAPIFRNPPRNSTKSWERGARSKPDVSTQPQAGTSRVLV